MKARIVWLYDVIRVYFGGEKFRRCYRCLRQIKRGETWTAKSWTDGLPRHWDCSRPQSTKKSEGELVGHPETQDEALETVSQ